MNEKEVNFSGIVDSAGNNAAKFQFNNLLLILVKVQKQSHPTKLLKFEVRDK